MRLLTLCLLLFFSTSSHANLCNELKDIKWNKLTKDIAQKFVDECGVTEKSSADSQYMLGRSLDKLENYTDAKKYYLSSAEQGHASAQNNLGILYFDGQGVTQSYQEAFKWHSKAAEQGSARAQANLGVLYYRGQGVTQSYQEAFKWHSKAAEQGHASAQNNLAIQYQNGQGVTQNNEKAIRWYSKAAKGEHKNAQIYLGHLLEETDQEEAAIKWLKLGAEYENTKSQSLLGNHYRHGIYIEKNTPMAVHYLEKAALKNDGWSAYLLGQMYQFGKDISYDLDKAKYWYQIAVNNDYTKAQSHLDNLDSIWFRMAQSTVNSTIDAGKATLEFAEENPEVAAVAAAIIAGGIASSLSSDDVCFRPNDEECNGWQSKQHKTLYDKVHSHMRGYAPTVGACDSSQQMAAVINGFVEQASWHVAGSVLRVLVDGDAEDIFVDIGEFRSTLGENNGC